MSDLFHHHPYLSVVAQGDVEFILEKDRSYAASWKMAGGRSAWHMLRRKMDRMIAMMTRPEAPPGLERALMNLPMSKVPSGSHYQMRPETMDWVRRALVSEDIFAKIAERPGGEDGSVLAEVRDLRRYLTLVEAEMMAQRHVEVFHQPRPDVVSILAQRWGLEPSDVVEHLLRVPPPDAGPRVPRRPEGDMNDTRPGYDAAAE